MSVIKSNMSPEEERRAIENYRPPNAHTIMFKRRVFELESWIEREHRFVQDEEIIARAMRLYNVDREQGRKYLNAVIEDFNHAGVRVIDNRK